MCKGRENQMGKIRSKSSKRNNLFFFLLLFLTACSHNDIYSDFHSIPNAEWNRNDKAVFNVDIPDSLNRYNVDIVIRNNENYPFQNIWLFVDAKTPKGSLRTDTLQIDLADIYGKWLGKGLSLYSLTIPYEQNFQFSYSGEYTYTIRQGMREDPLKGISEIGLVVSKTGN